MLLFSSNRMSNMIAPCRSLPRTLISYIDIQGRLRTIVRVDTHYHILVLPPRPGRDHPLHGAGRPRLSHQAEGQLRPFRWTQYWKAGQVLQCVDGAFCQPLPEEMVDRGMPYGPKYVAIEQLENQAKSIRPAVKHVKAMKHRDELDAEGADQEPGGVRAELAERQAAVDAEIAQLEGQILLPTAAQAPQ